MKRLRLLQQLLCVTCLLSLLAGPAMAREEMAQLDFQWLHEKQAALRLFHDEQYEEALKALQAVAATAPDESQRVELLSTAAITRAHLGQRDEALSSAKALPDKAWARYTHLRVLHVQKDAIAITETFADDAIQDWPAPFRAASFQMRGQAYLQEDKHQKALADYEQCVHAAADDTAIALPVMLDVAQLHKQLGENEKPKRPTGRSLKKWGCRPSASAAATTSTPWRSWRWRTCSSKKKNTSRPLNASRHTPLRGACLGPFRCSLCAAKSTSNGASATRLWPPIGKRLRMPTRTRNTVTPGVSFHC